MSNFPTITYIYDRYKKSSPSKEAIIEMRITYNKRQKYMSTGIKVLPRQWRKGRVVNRPDALQCNQLLDKLLADVRQVILDMVNHQTLDIFRIPEELQRLRRGKISFIDFCRQRAEVRKYGKTKDSQERYNRFMRYFLIWGKIQSFEEITEKNIIAYDRYLQKKGMKTYSKWNNYHRFLNSFILDAVREGLMQRNPYNWVNIEKDKTSKGIEKCLSPQEFTRLKNTPMPTKCLERIRDLFVFQTYTCLSYTDLRAFVASKITKIDGMDVYIGKRQKTSKTFTIPLLKEALDILYIYNKVLPVISNVKYNEYLKVVAQAAGIDKPISSHWARHTGATLLLNEGIDIKIVAKICGHSSTRITEQIYAKLLDETVVDAIKTSHLHRQEEPKV